MLRKEKQQGLTFLGYVIVLGIIGFFAVMIMKLAPLYLEYQSVVKILNSVAEQSNASTPPGTIRSTVQKQLDVNNIERITSRDVEIRREQGATVVAVDYEATTQFAGRLWFLMKFDHSVALRGS